MKLDSDCDFPILEATRKDCFLCRPATRLLVDVGAESFTMAGIGPQVPCYTIVSTIEHVDQLNDVCAIDEFASYVERIRSVLVKEFGSCLLTEHGHLPLCTLANTHTVHCYHPHVLLFPGVSGVQLAAAEQFQAQGVSFDSLSQALKFGRELDQYFLISDDPSSLDVYHAEDGLPRQLARVLVAENVGHIDQASWRNFPDFSKAEQNAAQLKKLLKRNM